MVNFKVSQTIGTLTRVQAGKAMPFAREKASAINKQHIDEAVTVKLLGIVGDEQADTFHHGGQHQAIHQMPLSVYELIHQHFPDVPAHPQRNAGILGENIIVEHATSTEQMTEKNVCVGDVYQIGTVHLEVSRPRRPCWKLDIQLRHQGIAKFLQDAGQVGWYYRVKQEGQFQVGNTVTLLHRPYPFATLESLWRIANKHSNVADKIEPWLSVDALEPSWLEIIQKRLNALKNKKN